jgi:Ca2+-binding RTX toxin-like protein
VRRELSSAELASRFYKGINAMASSSWFGGKSSRRSSDKQRSGKRTLQLENLEERRMMAADMPTAWITQGTLYVDGTNANDQIEVRFANNRIEISGIQIKNAQGQMVSSVSRSEVPYQVIAVGQGGDDYIAAVEAGDKALPCIFYGSQGNDTLIGGSEDDALVGMDGIDTLVGNAGNDKLIAALFADERDPWQPNDAVELLFGGDGDDLLR